LVADYSIAIDTHKAFAPYLSVCSTNHLILVSKSGYGCIPCKTRKALTAVSLRLNVREIVRPSHSIV